MLNQSVNPSNIDTLIDDFIKGKSTSIPEIDNLYVLLSNIFFL